VPAPLLPKDEVTARITGVFRRHGYEGASLSRLSKETGLGRSSLYHYFPRGKRDMGEAALAAAGAWIDEHAVAQLDSPGSPHARLARYAARMAEYYGDGRRACLVDLFGIGEAGALFRSQLRRRVKALLGKLAGVAEEAGVAPAAAARRAEDSLMAIQGALIVSRILGTRAPFRRIIQELPERLLHG
jgi:TetR/AcrR family transcriptional repressor of lmrAB and yxaGH operons